VREILPGVVIRTANVEIAVRFRGMYEGIRGSLLLLLSTAAPFLLWMRVTCMCMQTTADGPS